MSDIKTNKRKAANELLQHLDQQIQKQAENKHCHYVCSKRELSLNTPPTIHRFYFIDNMNYHLTASADFGDLQNKLQTIEARAKQNKSLLKRFVENARTMITGKPAWKSYVNDNDCLFVFSNLKTQTHYPLYMYDGLVERKNKRLLSVVNASSIRVRPSKNEATL